jgi:hypothetical protein
MKTLEVQLTDEQYDRFKAGFKKLQNLTEDPTDEQLIAQLRREASSVTYAAENSGNSNAAWTF